MKRIEDNLQIAVVRWFKLQHPDILIAHCPNGGFRTKVEGAIFKAMGVMPGFPDIMILKANDAFHALFIELKSPKGVQTESQKEFARKALKAGYQYEIIRSIDEFIELINNYLKN